MADRNNYYVYVYSATKETHQSLLGAIMERYLRNENMFYTIFFNNQLCIKILNNATVSCCSPVYRQGVISENDKFQAIGFPRVLV